MMCPYCRGKDGHYPGCPNLSDGNANLYMQGQALGLEGSQELSTVPFRQRTNPSFALGFREGRRRRDEHDSEDAVKRAWERATKKGAVIKGLSGMKFVTKADKGYRYRLVYDEDTHEVVISADDTGKMCFSKRAPDLNNWTCLIVQGTNPKGTVIFAEPSNQEV